MKTIRETVGDACDVIIYTMDETYVRLEYQNRRSWRIKV